MQTAKTVAARTPDAPFAHPVRNVASLGITPGMKVADFGSGSGAYVLAIAETLAHSGHVYAIDVQRDLLRKTKNEAHKRGYKNVEIIWGDLEHAGAAKIADGLLDVVLISNLLFQINDKHAVLREAMRVLKPAGRLVIMDWSESLPALPTGQAGGRQVLAFIGPQEVDVVTKENALSLTLSNGFEMVREFPAGSHHYGLVFRKKI